MATHNGQTFTGTTEVLDGNVYDGCVFTNCVLVYRGGDLPQMTHTRADACQWRLEDAAGRTVLLLKGLAQAGGIDGEKFVRGLLGLA
jgi:hypothetical protein